MSLDARLAATAEGLARSFEPRREAAYVGTVLRARRRRQRNLALAASFGAATALVLLLHGTTLNEFLLGSERTVRPARDGTTEELHRHYPERLDEGVIANSESRTRQASSGKLIQGSGILTGAPAGATRPAPPSKPGPTRAARTTSTGALAKVEPRVVEVPYRENDDGVPGWEYDTRARPGEHYVEIWIEDGSGQPIFIAVDVHYAGSSRIYDGCQHLPPIGIPEGADLVMGPWVRRSSDGRAPNGFFNPRSACRSLPTSGSLFVAFYRSMPE